VTSNEGMCNRPGDATLRGLLWWPFRPRSMMTADQHPAVNADPGEPPSLTLLLPPDVDSDEMLKGLAQAIGQARTDLAARAWRFRQLERDCAADGDQIRQALCRGQVRGANHAAALIDEAVIEVFGLWDQYPIPVSCSTGGGTPHLQLAGQPPGHGVGDDT
jgi:hypothetical protein